MALEKLKEFWRDYNKPTDGPKTVHIFCGFFFMVNFCLGTGFLGIPYSFYYSGYLAAIPSLLVISFVSWVNATYVVECMARAQALETYRKCTSNEIDSDNESSSSKAPLCQTAVKHPNFEITTLRKFEQTEMCEIFFNPWVKYFYLSVLSVYTFLATWTFSTVAGSAWAINIPFNTSTIQQCLEEDFLHTVIPAAPCLNAYYISLSIFGFLVVLLSLLDLSEQALVQTFLGLLRFITVGAIVVYCIVKLAEGSSHCVEDGAFNFSSTQLRNVSLTPPLNKFVLKFEVLGWLTAIPVFTYAFILHSGIPSLTHPIRQKSGLRWLLLAMFVTAGISYFSLGIVVPLWFKSDIQEICTLNWGELTKPPASIGLRVLSFYIILFPSLDVLSAFPLCVHTVVNNLYMIITGKDTSKNPTHRYASYDWLLRLVMRLVAAILPVLAAFGVANLIYVLKYAGLFGFIVCFGFPTALQLKSIYVCKKTFAQTFVSVSGEKLAADEEKDRELDQVMSSKEKAPLLSVFETKEKDKRELYMTPYSSRIFSHPIAVVIFGVLGFVLFLLTFVSLFLHPKTEVCYSDVSDPRLLDEL